MVTSEESARPLETSERFNGAPGSEDANNNNQLCKMQDELSAKMKSKAQSIAQQDDDANNNNSPSSGKFNNNNTNQRNQLPASAGDILGRVSSKNNNNNNKCKSASQVTLQPAANELQGAGLDNSRKKPAGRGSADCAEPRCEISKCDNEDASKTSPQQKQAAETQVSHHQLINDSRQVQTAEAESKQTTTTSANEAHAKLPAANIPMTQAARATPESLKQQAEELAESKDQSWVSVISTGPSSEAAVAQNHATSGQHTIINVASPAAWSSSCSSASSSSSSKQSVNDCSSLQNAQAATSLQVANQKSQQQQQQALICNNNSTSQLVNSKSGKYSLIEGAFSPPAPNQSNNNANNSLTQEQANLQVANQSAAAAAATNRASLASNQDDEHSLNQHLAFYCRRRRLSYLQSLLLRKWPCLALAICIMSSLILSLLLSALTVFMMHSVTNQDCQALKLSGPLTAAKYDSRMMLEAGGLGGPPSPFQSQLHEHQQQLELGAGSGAGELSGRVSAALASMTEQANSAAAASHFRRLSGAVKPLHYDLFIWPRIAEPFNFTGRVTMQLLCTEETKNITFHSRFLTLTESSLKLVSLNETAVVPKITKLDYDKELQHSIVLLDGPLKVGHAYALSVDFGGTLADDLAGFYRIRYEMPNATEPTWIAATQFQATDARKAFPCFDEPLFKATFSISIKHWKNMTAISNMPIVSSRSDDQLWVTDTFAKSLSMSTYLVAFAVTNFESRSEGNITVWARPSLIHTAEYALKIAPKILRHYEDFFGLKYPLPKMDMIALPDFNAGAMENWGLITYRETVMLLDARLSSVVNKERIANVVAHELAHQWFGNLVTPKWWDDLWLNEGFASFMEYYGVDHIEPQWKMMEKFSFDELQVALKLDSLSNSHPISVSVRSPEEISEIFDSISYSKGASVIRMMMNFLTEPVFKRGLQSYLKALTYSNAEQSDLWAHLAAALPPSDKIDVARVMNSWTLQTGYPLVTLKRSYNNSTKATLEQHRYQSHPKNQTAEQQAKVGETKWEVPITYTWKSNQNWDAKTKLWMHQNDSATVDLELGSVRDDEWVLMNINQVGFYRVNYDERNWQLIVDQLKQDHSKISSANRAQIMNDLMEMAKSGLQGYKLPMEATKYLASEQDYIPWDATLHSLDYVDSMLQRSSMYGDWLDYLKQVLEPLIARYRHNTWLLDANNNNQESANEYIEANKRASSVTWACQINDEHCVTRAKMLFAQWKANGTNEIEPILRFPAYCSAIEHGTRDDWDFLWSRYLADENASERDRILKALCCTRESWLLVRYLEMSFSSNQSNIRRQDGGSVIRMIARNNHGREIAFNFLRENWSTLKEYYGKSSFAFGQIIRSLARSMNTESDLKQVMDLYELVKGDLGTGRRMFQITLEEIEGNVNWRKRNFKFFKTWLKEFKMRSTKQE